MPAGPIGSVWAAGTWPDTTWEVNTWADALAIPATLEDLTTLWCHDYQPALHAAAAARSDDSGQIMINLAANVIGYDSENDLNTALAKYIEVTY